MFNLLGYIERQIEWSRETFGPGTRLKGVLAHLRKELDEVEKDPGDASEWADIIILAIDGAWRQGITPDQLAQALAIKANVNRLRQWPDWRAASPDAPIEHTRTPQ